MRQSATAMMPSETVPKAMMYQTERIADVTVSRSE